MAATIITTTTVAAIRYLFRGEVPLQLFNDSADMKIANASAAWLSWFGEGAALLNTYCYYNSDDDV